MSDQGFWLDEVFERASSNYAQLPEWARPVCTAGPDAHTWSPACEGSGGLSEPCSTHMEVRAAYEVTPRAAVSNRMRDAHILNGAAGVIRARCRPRLVTRIIIRCLERMADELECGDISRTL